MKFKYLILGAAVSLAFTSCDSYLDKSPDDRAELSDKEKLTQFLTSCYPSCNISVVGETSSDNMGNNGRTYNADIMLDQLYRFQDVDVTGNETPYYLWDHYYRAVAKSNEALGAAERLNDPKGLSAQIA